MMTKIAFNNCFGGFGLSNQAFEKLLDRKGIKWETTARPTFGIEYWMVGKVDNEHGYLSPYLFCHNRKDPDLIAVIEELSDKADGQWASLKIHELPVGTRYYINEYDGMETIITKDLRTEVA